MKGAFKLLEKHVRHNGHISSMQLSPGSRRPACEGRGVPWESRLVFLDRHASVSQAKGTVNPPRKWAPLSKPASLCFSLYALAACGFLYLVLIDPSRPWSWVSFVPPADSCPALQHLTPCAFQQRCPRSAACVLAGAGPWMAALVPRPPPPK